MTRPNRGPISLCRRVDYTAPEMLYPDVTTEIEPGNVFTKALAVVENLALDMSTSTFGRIGQWVGGIQDADGEWEFAQGFTVDEARLAAWAVNIRPYIPDAGISAQVQDEEGNRLWLDPDGQVTLVQTDHPIMLSKHDWHVILWLGATGTGVSGLPTVEDICGPKPTPPEDPEAPFNITDHINAVLPPGFATVYGHPLNDISFQAVPQGEP